MAEPQPDSIHEGVGALDIEDEVPALPKSAEDRKAAAALNSVADNDDDYYSGEPAKEVDQEALGRAMKNLGGGGTKSVGGREDDKGDGDKKKAAVKVDPSDVALLVSQLPSVPCAAKNMRFSLEGGWEVCFEVMIRII